MNPIPILRIPLALSAAGIGAARPNVVFIEVEDLTYSCVGAFDCATGRTPVIDGQVKRITDALQKKGLLDNTGVFFFSDQGVMPGPLRLPRPVAGGEPLLFNDRKDPGNTTNLAAREPVTVARLSDAIDAWVRPTGPRKPAKSQ